MAKPRVRSRNASRDAGTVREGDRKGAFRHADEHGQCGTSTEQPGTARRGWLSVARPSYHHISKVDVVQQVFLAVIKIGNTTSNAKEDGHPNVRECLEQRPRQPPSVDVARLVLQVGRDNNSIAVNPAADVRFLVILRVI